MRCGKLLSGLKCILLYTGFPKIEYEKPRILKWLGMKLETNGKRLVVRLSTVLINIFRPGVLDCGEKYSY
jgi:hypothetical protein